MKNKYLVLAGNSSLNLGFASALCVALGEFGKCEYVKYKHWELDGGKSIDIEKEFRLLMTRDGLGDTILIAKSAGIILALHAAGKSVLFKKYYFFGVPFGFAKGLGVDIIDDMKLLSSRDVTIMQNKFDPACHFDMLIRKFGVDNQKNITFIEGSRSDHYYPVKEVVRVVVKM